VAKCAHAAAEIAAGKRINLPVGNLQFYRDEHFSDYGVEMMWKMLQRDHPKDYVVGTGECHHGEEYLDLAFSYFNLDWKKYLVIDEGLKRPNEVVRLVADSSLAQKELGWNPHRITFKQHMDELCKYSWEKANGRVYKMPNMYTLHP
jgi:GDPmannose 4,6-dehydratase